MKDLKKYAPFIGLVFAVIAIFMLFLEPALSYKLFNESANLETTGFKVIFGTEDGFDFNFLGFLAILLVAAGAVIPFLNLSDKLKHLIAAVALIAGGILFFVFPSTIDVAFGSLSVAWPLIVAGVVSILGGAVNLVGAVA